MLKSFVSFNRRIATSLEKCLPIFFKGQPYTQELVARINADIQQLKPAVILEVGGIDRPLLRRSPGFQYVGLDIEAHENCFKVYDQFIVQSIEDPVSVRADMVVSITLLEHVRNNSAAVGNMFAALANGGTTHHYVPSKWHPYAVALRLVGPALQRRLIAALRPAAVDVTGYPAFFDHCTPGQMKALFRSSGFSEIDVKVYYEASDYFAFFVPAFIAVAAFENVCRLLKLEIFASGFVISATK